MRFSPICRNISQASSVHVLGLGSIGTFIAHALADVPNSAPVTLLLHRSSLMDGYVRNGNQLQLKTRQGEVVARSGYAFEMLHGNKWYRMSQGLEVPREPTSVPIDDLVVCVKSTQTVAALRPLVHRLTPKSSIMFLQNGAGMIEDVNQHLFPDLISRPNYITGVISHGVTLNSPFNITHTGDASTSIGLVPRGSAPRGNDESGEVPPVSSSLLRTLPLIPRLSSKSYEWPEILQIQLEKLAVNAVSNPLCALSDPVTGGATAYVFTIPDTCRALVREISSVAVALPELQGIPGVTERFSPDVLGATVRAIHERNRETITSMVWDMRAGRQTEIRYINGYWSRRGRDVGVRTPLNDELVARVEARTAEMMQEAQS
jgi:2-dehydropantoate 2-reductase